MFERIKRALPSERQSSPTSSRGGTKAHHRACTRDGTPGEIFIKMPRRLDASGFMDGFALSVPRPAVRRAAQAPVESS